MEAFTADSYFRRHMFQYNMCFYSRLILVMNFSAGLGWKIYARVEVVPSVSRGVYIHTRFHKIHSIVSVMYPLPRFEFGLGTIWRRHLTLGFHIEVSWPLLYHWKTRSTHCFPGPVSSLQTGCWETVDKEGMQKLSLGSHLLGRLLPSSNASRSTGLTHQPQHSPHCHAQGFQLESWLATSLTGFNLGFIENIGNSPTDSDCTGLGL